MKSVGESQIQLHELALTKYSVHSVFRKVLGRVRYIYAWRRCESDIVKYSVGASKVL